MSNYGEMQARINDEIGLPIVVARIPNAILSAIRFYENGRWWFTEGESTTPSVVGQNAYAVPVDFIAPDVLTITDTVEDVRYVLTRRPWSWMRHHLLDNDSLARSDDWSYYADQFWLFPIPDQAYTLTLSYRKRLTALSAFADTNEWMVEGEELIRSRAKWDLMAHTAKDYKGAEMMKGAEIDALYNLRRSSEQKIASERMSFDDGLLTSRGHYNINYQ